MSVTKEPSGRRSVQVEIEVPGTPEEVWQAIATGPGISAWFMPTVVEEHDGKPVSVAVSFGPDMQARSVVKAWDPPRMFVKESESWMPGGPSMAEEWRVEAQSGGVCMVRIVHSHFADSDDWDNQLEATQSAWPAFLRTLQLYMTHFRGQRAELIQLSAQFAGTEAEAWDSLTTSLGANGLSIGERWTTPAGVPSASGVLAYNTESPYDALLRIELPSPGIAALGVATYPGGQCMVAMNIYLYGNDTATTMAREAPRWQQWFQERFQ